MDIAVLTGPYTYLILFFAMFILGETVFMPAVYLSLNNQLNPILVILVSALATSIADLIWYYVAAHVPVQKLKKWHRVERHQHTFNRLSELFDAHSYRILFLSKFVYGTRILVQLISGMKKIPVWKYLGVNALGIISYMLFLYVIAIAVDTTVARYVLGGFKFGIVSFILLAVIINVCIHLIAKRKWSL